MKPYKFQEEFINRARDKSSFAFLMEPGTGKTCCTINVLRYHYNINKRIMRTVIFAPVIVLRNWIDEFALWSKIPREKMTVVQGTKAKRIKLIESGTPILIINYDAVVTADVSKALQDFKPEIVICDESQRIKSRTAKKAKEVIKVANSSKHRYILTGTPVTNSIEDLWNQFYFLDKGTRLGNNFFAFKNRYMVNLNASWAQISSKAFPNWQVRPGAVEELKEKIADISCSITTRDAVELPELVENTIKFELSKEQRKHYVEVKKELVTWLDDQEDNPLIVQNALVKLLRLNEISAGYMKMLDDKLHTFKDNPRLKTCIELVKDLLPEKIIIFTIYKETYKHLASELEKMNVKYVMLTGEVSSQDKYEAVEEFNNGDASVVIANPRSAGLGINLKSAKYKIYYAKSFSLEDYLQSQKRNYRAGSIDLHKTVVDYHLVATDTIDDTINEALLNKEKLASSVIDLKELL